MVLKVLACLAPGRSGICTKMTTICSPGLGITWILTLWLSRITNRSFRERKVEPSSLKCKEMYLGGLRTSSLGLWLMMWITSILSPILNPIRSTRKKCLLTPTRNDSNTNRENYRSRILSRNRSAPRATFIKENKVFRSTQMCLFLFRILVLTIKRKISWSIRMARASIVRLGKIGTDAPSIYSMLKFETLFFYSNNLIFHKE